MCSRLLRYLTNMLLDDMAEPGVWTAVEVYVGIICVCLPAIRPFFRAIRHAIFGETQKPGYCYDDVGFSGRARPSVSGIASSNDTKVGVMSRSESTEDLFHLQKP